VTGTSATEPLTPTDPERVRWLSVFLDTPVGLMEPETAFWSEVVGAAPGAPVGDDGEFLPLDPPDADPSVWLQRTRDDSIASHPDLYVVDVVGASARATRLGATETRRRDGLVMLRSPGGLPFCLVRWRGQRTLPAPVGDAGGLVDQICLDIPADRFGAELDFWCAFTGWSATEDRIHDEFARLRRPPELPHAFLLQGLATDRADVGTHLDLSARDREDEVRRHVAAGAQVAAVFPHRTVLDDPVGRRYCVTARTPGDV
jgi:hypothetical protein